MAEVIGRSIVTERNLTDVTVASAGVAADSFSGASEASTCHGIARGRSRRR
jgi:hypothetical protein